METYGYFDDGAREYVITRPDTPQPWTNYSGNREYGAVYSNNAAGYSFVKSPATGRLLRYSYVLPQASQPGRFFYLRDAADGDFWSTSWLPVRKPLTDYESRCRMGTAYTAIESTYRGIAAEAVYFVPLGQRFEYWLLTVTNTTDEARSLDCFAYAEFSMEWQIGLDAFDQQYSNAINVCRWKDGMVSGGRKINLPELPEDFSHPAQSRWWYMFQSGDVNVEKYDLDREAFLGSGSYAAPDSVVRGQSSGAEAYGDVPCGALQSRLELQPGESRTLAVVVGEGRSEREGLAVRDGFGSVPAARAELEKLKTHWHALLDRQQVETPDAAFNSMVNVWNAYNALMTFEWSRSCSLVYSGQHRDGLGYRDSVQDVLGVLHSIPELVRDRLLLMLSGQESGGGAQPEINPVHFKPGQMPPVELSDQRADDCLWLFNAIPAYVAETGESDFYDLVVPYADGGEDSVYGHLKRALRFNLHHRGRHGLTCGLKADWNDCIILGENGESVFVSLQLRFALEVFAGLAAERGLPEDAKWAEAELKTLDAALQEHAWDGEWFIRAFPESGETFGSSKSSEGQIFLNPQSWAVISGAATDAQAESAMRKVDEMLATDYGLMLHASSYRDTPPYFMNAVNYLPGTKENGAVFQHTQGWAVMADCLLGHGERAYRHFRAYMPAAQNEIAALRQTEPYVYAQWTHAADSPKCGTSRLPWLSGTATWSYFTATQYILGIRPEADGLRIDPCIPSNWPGFAVRRIIRGKTVRIRVNNEAGVEKGVVQIREGDRILAEGSLLSYDRIVDGMDIEVVMG